MAPSLVVEALDVGKDIASGFCACCILSVMDPLGFERVEEAFHRCIVVAVALAPHRGGDPIGGEGCAIVVRCVLNTTVGMVHQAGAGPLG
jgi:hypothetical protein